MTLPLDGAAAGELVIERGAAHVTLRGDAALAALCHARFEGLVPEVRAQGGRIEIEYPRFWPTGWLHHAFLSTRQSADLTLNAQVPWTIAIHGGVAHFDADLRTLRLGSFEVRGGASHLSLALSRPAGMARVTVHGGASHLQLRRPVGVPVRLQIGGGTSRLELDEMRFGAIGGRFDWQSPDYAAAADKYEINIAGGTSRLTILAE